MSYSIMEQNQGQKAMTLHQKEKFRTWEKIGNWNRPSEFWNVKKPGV